MINYGYTNNFIIAASIPIAYTIKPVSDMKTKEYVSVDSTAANGTIQKTENAYPEIKDNGFFFQPKVDFAWTPFMQTKDGVEIAPRFGFIGSFSGRYSLNNETFALNFSIGPSLHPKWSTSNVITSVQFEFLDFANSTGDKDFNDIFYINLYVGLPLQMKTK